MKIFAVITWIYSGFLFSAHTHLIWLGGNEDIYNPSGEEFVVYAGLSLKDIGAGYENINKITIKHVHLFHLDTPDEWTSFLSQLPRFSNVKQIVLDNCDKINSNGGCFSIGLAKGWLGKNELKEFVTAIKDLGLLNQLDISSSFKIDDEQIKYIRSKLKKPGLIVR